MTGWPALVTGQTYLYSAQHAAHDRRMAGGNRGKVEGRKSEVQPTESRFRHHVRQLAGSNLGRGVRLDRCHPARDTSRWCDKLSDGPKPSGTSAPPGAGTSS